MILAWVISLLLLCSALVAHLERLNAIRIVEVETLTVAQQHFIAAEKAVLECEQNITALSNLKKNSCFVQPAGKNRWLISSKTKPTIQIGVVIDDKTGTARRFNWRQAFD